MGPADSPGLGSPDAPHWQWESTCQLWTLAEPPCPPLYPNHSFCGATGPCNVWGPCLGIGSLASGSAGRRGQHCPGRQASSRPLGGDQNLSRPPAPESQLPARRPRPRAEPPQQALEPGLRCGGPLGWGCLAARLPPLPPRSSRPSPGPPVPREALRSTAFAASLARRGRRSAPRGAGGAPGVGAALPRPRGPSGGQSSSGSSRSLPPAPGSRAGSPSWSAAAPAASPPPPGSPGAQERDGGGSRFQRAQPDSHPPPQRLAPEVALPPVQGPLPRAPSELPL